MSPRNLRYSAVVWLSVFVSRYICDLFKEAFIGEILWFMINCTEDERINALDTFKNISGDFTGIIEVEQCELREVTYLLFNI